MEDTMNQLRERLFLQQYLKNAEKQNQQTYAKFLRAKLNGEVLSLEDLTTEELQSLYVEERVIDKQIANLFGVTHKEIQEKRNQWAIQKELSFVS